MKHIKILSLFLLTALIGAMEKEDPNNYLNRFLPEDSLIRERCNEKEGRARDGARNVACDGLENYLKSFDEKDPRCPKPFVEPWAAHAVPRLLMFSIRAILPDQSDDAKWKEYNSISSAGDAVEWCRERKNQRLAQKAAQKKRKKKHSKL